MLERLKIRLYRLLPTWLKPFAVRWGTPNFTAGAAALLTDDGSRLLLVRLTYREGWLLPGGFLGKGETAVAALHRELQEELGIDAVVLEPHRTSHDVRLRGVTFCCVVKLAPDTAILPQGPEIVEARWFPLDALPPFPQEYAERLTELDLAAVRAVG